MGLRTIGLSFTILCVALSGIAGGQAAAFGQAYQMPDQVVVTAQKREQSIDDVPIAITAITAEVIDKAHARSLSDIQNLAPSVSLEPASGYNTLSIRGVGGGGRNIGFETRVGLFIDGVYIGQPAALSQPLFDIAQVEVLRGPQGFLFGHNTVAGAINLVTAPPTRTRSATLRLGFGDRRGADVAGSLEGPVIGDNVVGRLSAAYDRRDGTTTNLFTGDTIGNVRRLSLRGRARVMALGPISLDIGSDYSEADDDHPVGEPQTYLFGVTGPGFPAPKRRVNFNHTPFSHERLAGSSATVNAELPAGLLLTSITAYRYARQRQQNDTDYSPNDLLYVDFRDNSHQFTEELRLVSPANKPIRSIAGLYLLNEISHSMRAAIVGQDVATIVPTPYPGVFAPYGAAFGLTAGAPITAKARISAKSAAAFLAVDADVTDWLTISLGARYTHDTKSIRFDLDGSKSGSVGIATLKNYIDRRHDDRMTPTASVTVALSDTVKLYGRYSTGFKSGGYNVDFLNVGQIGSIPFNAETVTNYEAGVKGTVLDGRLHFALAAYQADYRNFQVFQFVALAPGVTVLQLRNAAKVRSRGLDAEAELQISEGLALSGLVGLTDAHFQSFPNGGGPGVDLAGNKLPNAPTLSGTGIVNYTVPLAALGGALNLHLEYSYRASSFGAATNDPVTDEIGARNLVHARFGYKPEGEKWQISLWSRNLFDEDYVIYRAADFFSNRVQNRGEPRSFGVEWASTF